MPAEEFGATGFKRGRFEGYTAPHSLPPLPSKAPTESPTMTEHYNHRLKKQLVFLRTTRFWNECRHGCFPLALTAL